MSGVHQIARRAIVAPCVAIAAMVATPEQVRLKPDSTIARASLAEGRLRPAPTTIVPAQPALSGQEPPVSPTPGHGPAPSAYSPSPAAIVDLQRKHLRIPIDGVKAEVMKGQFGDTRDSGTRGHEAVDLLAPRNTEIHAVEDGTIEKLFLSKPGGLTIYQFDPARRYAYYYAHLERYATGLREHGRVSRGEVIGFVGTSGNAPKNTPHLHFAIFELTAARQWWKGTPIDPWLAFIH